MKGSCEVRRLLLDFYDRRGRDLPWRRDRDPYRVWISEVMLQQTRVDAVTPYYERWLARFPDVAAVADADLDDVLAAWAGLGYYRRARNLHAAARVVRDRHDGRLPDDPRDLRALPGVGEYTAGAIGSIAFDRPAPAVDGNARRVLARLFDLPSPTPAALRRVAAELVDGPRPGDLNQALMELGATICAPRRPDCGACPVAAHCRARARGTVARRPGVRSRSRVSAFAFGSALVVAPSGRVLLARRPASGLLGGLWEFPGAQAGRDETPAAAARRVCRALTGLRPRPRGLAVVDHRYSHRRHAYHGFLFRAPREVARLASTSGAAAWTELAWCAPAELAAHPLPAAQSRLAGHLAAA